MEKTKRDLECLTHPASYSAPASNQQERKKKVAKTEMQRKASF
jgi:hypothetical protein